ncbi:MAG: DUF4097 family beta strand repeat-containing protein, partial [Gemmatimonadota bacterium]
MTRERQRRHPAPGSSRRGRAVRTRASGTVAALVLLAGAASARGQATERFTLSGERVAIHNLAGQARLEPGSGASVIVTVTRGGSEGSRLRLEQRAFDGIETLIVHYPEDEVVYSGREHGESEIRVGEDGRLDEGRRRVRVSGRGGGLEAHADLVISVPPGSDVELHHGVGEVTATGVQADLLIDVSSGPVRTSETQGLLNIDTGSGSVDVTSARGDLRVDTGSGSVRVSGASGNGILVDTGSGSVRLADIETSNLGVDTGSGSIELGGVRANDVLLDTGSGGVDVELLQHVDNLVIDTGSGGVTVFFPGDLGAEIEVETGSGGIDVEFPITVQLAERTHLVGRIGDGRGRIRIDT